MEKIFEEIIENFDKMNLVLSKMDEKIKTKIESPIKKEN